MSPSLILPMDIIDFFFDRRRNGIDIFRMKDIDDLVRRAMKLRQELFELKRSCKWTERDYGDWMTECGQEFVWEDDTPAATGVKFCSSCGHAAIFEYYVERGELE